MWRYHTTLPISSIPGVTHFDSALGVRTVFHQKQDVPHVQPREECVTLFAGNRVFPEGEAFLGVGPGG
jgi:hypothetical protein